MPLDQELYSQDTPNLVSENREILEAIRWVLNATQVRGVWLDLPGGDQKKILKVQLNHEHGFIMNQRGERHLVSGLQRTCVQEWGNRFRRSYREVVVNEKGSGEKLLHLEFGRPRSDPRSNRLPCSPDPTNNEGSPHRLSILDRSGHSGLLSRQQLS